METIQEHESPQKNRCSNLPRAIPSPWTTGTHEKEEERTGLMDSSINTTDPTDSQQEMSESEQIVAFAEKLLSGEIYFHAFDTIEVHEITHDVRLLHAYEKSEANNITEFLALGGMRKKLRNYGKISEKKLLEAIVSYLDKHQINVREEQRAVLPLGNFNHNSLLDQLKKDEGTRNIVSAHIWSLMTNELESSMLADQLVASIAAELDMAWPYSLDSAFCDKRIGDLLGYSLSELQDFYGFGKKRVRTYAACVIYLHKLLTEEHGAENHSIKDTVINLWENSGLKEREKKVLHLRFGIQDERKHTLAEIKEYFGITRERVRQIEKKALAKVRMNRYFETLPDQILENKGEIWKQLTTDSKLRKRDWMEPLEDQLGFEYQLAIELIDYRKHRNTGASALGVWLDMNFPNDETYWYKSHAEQTCESHERTNQMNGQLIAFLNEI